MDEDRWRQVKEIFIKVVDEPKEAREARIASLCGEDSDLAEEVRTLLAGDDQTLLEHPGQNALQEGVIKEIGPFDVIREIGRGGMGRVFEVHRKNEEFEQRLALKLVHPTLSGENIHRRFQLERRILAKLEHRNIARFIDGGVSSMGPFYVMEFIDGKPITEFCDEKKITIRQRIRLFAQVCSAVQFSHQHFIVHRDIKPGNILVTDDGTVKLLDFGIAKVMEGDGTTAFQKTIFQTYTQDEAPMTPIYASPEQYLNEPVTAASDVYSLGLVLYQLLTGRLAYDFDNKSLLEIDNLILREPPTHPSSKSRGKTDKGFSSEEIAQKRHLTPDKLESTLKGDLDAIVLTALRKDPKDRYASVADFADDLRCYLDYLPVSASPPSAAYRTKMFVRRHKTGVAFAAILLLSIIGGSIGTLLGWSRAVEARDLAQKERARAIDEVEKTTEILSFLKGMLASPDPRKSGREVKIIDVLDKSAADLERELGDRPEIEASIRQTLGVTYNVLGDHRKALEQFERARHLWAKLEGPNNRKVLDLRNHIASAYHELGQYDKARELLEGNREDLDRELGPEDPITLRNQSKLAVAYKTLGKLTEAEHILKEMLPTQVRILGQDDEDTLSTMEILGNVISDQGRYAEAEEMYLQVLDLLKKQHDAEHPDLLEIRINLATIHYVTGNLAQAEREFRQLLESTSRVFGPHHTTTLTMVVNLTTVLNDQKKNEEALKIGEEYLPIMNKEIGEDQMITLAAINGLANSVSGLGMHQKAKTYQKELLRIVTEKFGAEHPEAIMVLCNLGLSHQRLNEFDDAIKCHQGATKLATKKLGEDHLYALVSRYHWGKDLFLSGEKDRGKKIMLETKDHMISVFGEDHPLPQSVLEELHDLFPNQDLSSRAE